MLISILVVFFLVAGINSLNSHREKVDDEQEFRMYQDPEYRKFIEEKRAFEKAEADERSRRNRRNLMIIALIVIIVLSFMIWFSWYYY